MDAMLVTRGCRMHRLNQRHTHQQSFAYALLAFKSIVIDKIAKQSSLSVMLALFQLYRTAMC